MMNRRGFRTNILIYCRKSVLAAPHPIGINQDGDGHEI